MLLLAQLVAPPVQPGPIRLPAESLPVEQPANIDRTTPLLTAPRTPPFRIHLPIHHAVHNPVTTSPSLTPGTQPSTAPSPSPPTNSRPFSTTAAPPPSAKRSKPALQLSPPNSPTSATSTAVSSLLLIPHQAVSMSSSDASSSSTSTPNSRSWRTTPTPPLNRSSGMFSSSHGCRKHSPHSEATAASDRSQAASDAWASTQPRLSSPSTSIPPRHNPGRVSSL